ncbi:hypothetical protein D044_3871B, partial [Vibrio parahaemolyticus EKP-026]
DLHRSALYDQQLRLVGNHVLVGRPPSTPCRQHVGSRTLSSRCRTGSLVGRLSSMKSQQQPMKT